MSTKNVETIAKQWEAMTNQELSTHTGLIPPLVNLVMQYLPTIEDWMTEWTGERGREVVAYSVARAWELPGSVVDLIVEYLKKSDLFGLAEVERAAGGKEELTKLLGNYNPEQPVPADIDDLLQMKIFAFQVPGRIPGQSILKFARRALSIDWKISGSYSLYWCPKGMTANIAEKLALKHNTEFSLPEEFDKLQFNSVYGDKATEVDRWVLFPNCVFLREWSFQEQQERIPEGFEFPCFSDAAFCIFMHFICTGNRLLDTSNLGEDENLFTRCREQIFLDDQPKRLILGGFDDDGLYLSAEDDDPTPNFGVALVRAFPATNPAQS